MQTSHLAPRVQEANERLRAENKELREVIRKQGQFIQDMKKSIKGFLNHPPVRV